MLEVQLHAQVGGIMPSQQPPPWGPRPSPKKRPKRLYVWFSLLVIAAVVVAVGLMSGGNSGTDPPRSPNQEQTSPTESGARADVEITKCSVSSATSWPEAALRVTNNSSKTSNYVINVEFVDSNNVRIAEGFTAVNNLAAGQVASEKANGFTETSGSVVCRITDVTRYAS